MLFFFLVQIYYVTGPSTSNIISKYPIRCDFWKKYYLYFQMYDLSNFEIINVKQNKMDGVLFKIHFKFLNIDF